MAKWQSTKYPGVRFREHPTRKHGIQSDRYFVVRYTLDGKQREESLGWASEGWTPQLASEERARLKRAQRTGEGPQTLTEARERESERRQAEEAKREQEKREAITFDAFFEHNYRPHAERHKAKRTFATELSYYGSWIKPVIGNKPVKDVAPLDLERIKKRLQDAGRSAKTIQHVLAIVRMVINQAATAGLYHGENPTLKVKRPTADNRRVRFLSYEEAEELLDTLGRRSPDVRDMALLSLHCGPRAGEIFGLTWRDIDFERGIVTLRHTKNGQVRHVPMTDRVRAMLQDRKAARTGNLVFPARGGGKRKEVSNIFERIIRELGWNEGVDDPRQRLVFHSLRHTCASWLVMAGVPLYTVKEYLGHKQISQTERYAHLCPDSLQQATSALNGIGKQAPKGKVVNLR